MAEAFVCRDCNEVKPRLEFWKVYLAKRMIGTPTPGICKSCRRLHHSKSALGKPPAGGHRCRICGGCFARSDMAPPRYAGRKMDCRCRACAEAMESRKGKCRVCSTPMSVSRGRAGWCCERCDAVRKAAWISSRRRLKAIDPSRACARYWRSRVRAAVKSGRGSPALEAKLGYSIAILRCHLESKFTPGMTWEAFNRGEIHIDHRYPISLYDLSHPTWFRMAWALSNLQPLWAADNIRKGTKWKLYSNGRPFPR